MVVKKNKKRSADKENEITDPEVKEFMDFFKIELKSDEEVSELTREQRKQYECRVKRWESLIETQVDFEIFKALKMFDGLDEALVLTKMKINEVRDEPDFEDKYDSQYKKDLDKREKEAKEMRIQLEHDRQAFDDIYIPYKKRKSEERERQIKEEKEVDIKAEDDSDIAIKEEYVSEEDSDDSEVQIKDEVKEEYISEEDSSGEYLSFDDENSFGSNEDNKSKVKKEIKSEIDVKPNIKTEIKSEIKSEIKNEIKNEVKEEYTVEDNGTPFVSEVKKEYVSSEDESS